MRDFSHDCCRINKMLRWHWIESNWLYLCLFSLTGSFEVFTDLWSEFHLDLFHLHLSRWSCLLYPLSRTDRQNKCRVKLNDHHCYNGRYYCWQNDGPSWPLWPLCRTLEQLRRKLYYFPFLLLLLNLSQWWSRSHLEGLALSIHLTIITNYCTNFCFWFKHN